MIADIWKELGVPEQAIRAHKKQYPCCKHAWVVGIADPTSCIPEGHIFAIGLSQRCQQPKLFATRSPCVKPCHERMLPSLQSRPNGMSK